MEKLDKFLTVKSESERRIVVYKSRLLRRLPLPLTKYRKGAEADQGLEPALHAVLTPLAQGRRLYSILPGGKSGSGYDQAYVADVKQLRHLLTGHGVGEQHPGGVLIAPGSLP